MKITLIREERESGKEAVSTQETDMLMEKLKTENKTGYITELRSIIPHLKGTNARYEHIDRLPRLYPAVEMTRTKAGEHRIKTYNAGTTGSKQSGRGGRSRTGETTSRPAAANLCRLLWLQRTKRQNMGTLHPARRRLPKNEDDIALFHAHAYRLAVKCYQPFSLSPSPSRLLHSYKAAG